MPLGVTWIESDRQFNLSLYAPNAARVRLDFFTADDSTAPVLSVQLDPRLHVTWSTWHFRLDESVMDASKIVHYAYHVDNGDAPGSDWDKVLLDPMAHAVFFPPGHDRGAACVPGSNAGKAPLGWLEPAKDGLVDVSSVPAPRHESDLVIYELHVKNFTQLDASVPAAHRGTWLGVVDKIPYLVDLGVTAVELMPVYEVDPKEAAAYWGYSPLNFFSPTARFASVPGESVHEFRTMVLELHKAGIEVILDVVYNHTTEGNYHGPNYSLRGIANNSYYIMADDKVSYWDASGTGSTLCSSEAVVRTLILESLRYWASEMGVDGFRFDLATALTRTDGGGYDATYALISEINAEPVLANTRLIAEAWDAAGGYQLGQGWPGQRWQQWNGKFRDSMRRFVKGDGGLVPEIMQRLYGSDDLFPDDSVRAHRPYQSVNFVTCHDGFCLYDLVSYNNKNNVANGENNQDGSSDNGSWNCGEEGDPAPAGVMALRQQQARNFFTLLMLSNGTPMFRAGDEWLNTQGGNNNPYNQDNTISWLDWTKLTLNADVYRFFKRMIAFRKEHPSLGPGRFWHDRVAWYGVQGAPDMGAESRSIAFFLRGADLGCDDLYVMINMWWQPLTFRVQSTTGAWQRVIDTAAAAPDDFIDPAARVALASLDVTVQGRSVVVLSCR